ncbi:MAG: DNA polymerase III subunit beta [Clostridiales bacterium]|nr:DNA polymerase III subunit beta [Clostridiales bacterium]
MKFTCEKALLLSGVTTASRTVAPKSTIPALEGVLIEAGNGLVISGYNLKTGIRTRVSADVSEKGAIVLNSRLLGEIVRRMADDTVTFSSDAQGLVKMSCGMSKYELMGTSAEDFPELPSVDAKHSISIPERTLKSVISQTLFAVSDNEARPVHTGSLFEIQGSTLTVVSVDGFRLALRRETLESAKLGDTSFVVPGATLSEVEKICSDTDRQVVVSLGERHIMFTTGETEVISRRLEGEFLDYRRSIASPAKYEITVKRKDIIESVERVSLIISEKIKSPLRFRFADGSLQIYTMTALGTASDEIMVHGDGENLEMGFNNRYVLDALKAAPAEEVCIRVASQVSPCILVPADGSDSFLYMILPVRIRTEERV